MPAVDTGFGELKGRGIPLEAGDVVVHTTARRECLHILRHTTSIPHFWQTIQEAATDPSTTPEHITIKTETTQSLCEHVDELPPRQRTVLRALFTDNPQPYAQIATTTGIPPGGIGPTRNRALQQLRQKLDKDNTP